MCLARPAKVKSIDGDKAIVDVSGVQREASVMMTPKVKVGDYIIMHAGFAIQILDTKEAEETLKLLEEIAAAAQDSVDLPDSSKVSLKS
jgi:hydrogenase expression/formation protein HypC